MPHEVSIVIVSYNVKDLLLKCLESIRTSGVNAEVVVVDNNSSDGTQSTLAADTSIISILNPDNKGFSFANNQGMGASFSPYILLLNPDTELKSGALRRLLDFAKGQKIISLIGPQLLNSDGTLQTSAWKKPTPLNMILETVFLHKLFGISEYPQEEFQKQFEPGMLSGAALLFPRELYNKIGGLDPKLFWMEDADFAYRARAAGARITYLPTAQIIHHSGQSSKKNQSVVITNQLLSKLKYYRKHSGLFPMLFASLFCFFHIISRILIFGLLAPFNVQFPAKAKGYLYALPRFFSYLFASDQRVTG